MKEEERGKSWHLIGMEVRHVAGKQSCEGGGLRSEEAQSVGKPMLGEVGRLRKLLQ